MLDVKRLRVLREVAARGSFSGAADALSYTQSAISQQIAALEREAGARLVERSARGVRLTDAGAALVSHTDAILARLDAAERELEAIAGLRGGHLRMVSLPSAAASLLPLAIAEFRRRHPAVEISLSPGEPADAVAALKAGDCDLAISLEALGYLLATRDAELAARLLGATEALRTRHRLPDTADASAEREAGLATLRAALDTGTLAAAWTAGQSTPLDLVVDEAVARVAALTA